MENEEIGKRIKQRRNDMEISIMELAKVTGLSKATLHRYESGEIKNIKTPIVNAIAERLNVSPEWLVGETDVMKREIDKETTDLNSIFTYTLKLIRNFDFSNKGKEVDVNTLRVIEATLEYQIKLLELQDNKE